MTIVGTLIIAGFVLTAIQWVWIELVPQKSRTSRRTK